MAYGHVLAAVDLSDESVQVIEKAREIAGKDKARLSLVTVVRPQSQTYRGGVGFVPGVAYFERAVQRQAEVQLRDHAFAYDVDPKDVHVSVGSPAPEIRDTADRIGADLIVMGTHGRHGLGLLLGSTASGVLHGVERDVLTVRLRPVSSSSTAAGQAEPTRVMVRLEEDHRRLAEVLAVLERQFATEDVTPETPDFAVVAEIAAYISEFPDAVHHPTEDALFSALEKHDLTRSERRLVEQNAAQHVEIAKKTHEIKSEIDTVIDGAVIRADALFAHVHDYIALQRAHMLREERQVFPLAVQHLDAEDFAAIEARLTEDPLFDLERDKYARLATYVAASPIV